MTFQSKKPTTKDVRKRIVAIENLLSIMSQSVNNMILATVAPSRAKIVTDFMQSTREKHPDTGIVLSYIYNEKIRQFEAAVVWSGPSLKDGTPRIIFASGLEDFIKKNELR